MKPQRAEPAIRVIQVAASGAYRPAIPYAAGHAPGSNRPSHVGSNVTAALF